MKLAPAYRQPVPSFLLRLVPALGIAGTLLLLLSWALSFSTGHALVARASQIRRGQPGVSLAANSQVVSHTWYVASHGDDGNACDDKTAPCRRIQVALDRAEAGDTIDVAQGLYTETAGTVVEIEQQVTLLGGWNVSFTARAPLSYPMVLDAQGTVLDAQGGGPVVVVRGPPGMDPISPRIEGFVLTHGNGTGVAGCVAPGAGGCGGGLFGTNATPLVIGNLVVNNLATTHGEGFGGGIYLQGQLSGGLIQGNVIVSNMATLSSTAFISGWGGGICLHNIAAVVQDNYIQGNVASAAKGWGYGGGLLLYRSAAQVIGNVVADNLASAVASGDLSGWGGGISVVQSGDEQVSIVGNELRGNLASVAGHGWGGGVQIGNSTVLISGNLIISNVSATSANRGDGGGIYGRYGTWSIRGNHILSNTSARSGMGFGGGCQLENGNVTLEHNLIAGNTATEGASNGLGGGVNLLRCDGSFVRYNTLRDNLASKKGAGYGGGLSVRYGPLSVEGNRILGNRATAEGISHSWGGGVRVDSAAPVTFTNNLIAHNQARTEGGGLHVFGNITTTPGHAILIHNTLADNAQAGGDEGIYLAQHASVAMTNNIVVSHSYGIFGETALSAAVADYTLFHGNQVADTAGTVTSSHVITGAPHFIGADDFHIRTTSAALDSGIKTYVDDDLDGDPRPSGDAVDLGADEVSLPDLSASHKNVDQAQVLLNDTLVYTLTVHNAGERATTFLVTDTLDARTVWAGFGGPAPGRYGHAAGVVTWTGTVERLSQVQLVFLAAVNGEAGDTVTNSARFAGGTGEIYTDAASSLIVAPVLSATQQVEPGGAVRAGAFLTYTLVLSNSGSSVARVSLSDTLPAPTAYVTGSARVFSAGPTYTSPRYVGSSVTWKDDVPPGETVTVAFQAQVKPGTVTGTLVNNVAWLQELNVPGPLLSVSQTNVILAPVLSVGKRSAPADPVRPGQVLTFGLVLTNAQGGIARVVITDPLPLHTSYISGSVGVSGGSLLFIASHYDPVDERLTWQCDLGPRSVVRLTFAARVDQEAGNGTVISNTAQVQELSQPDVIFNVGVTRTVVAPELKGLKQVEPPGQVQSGTVLTYTIRVTNTGGVTAQVSLSDPLPAHTTFVSGSARVFPPTHPAPDLTGQTVVWQGGLGPRDGVTLTFFVRLDPGIAAGTAITNVAWVDELSDPAPATAYQVSNAVARYEIYLPLVLRNN